MLKTSDNDNTIEYPSANKLPRHYDTLKQYYLISQMALDISLKVYMSKTKKDPKILIDEVTSNLKGTLCTNCLIGWLSIDDFRLTDICQNIDDSHISYGLFTRYPYFVNTYAEYVCSPERRTRLETLHLNHDEISTIYEVASSLALETYT